MSGTAFEVDMQPSTSRTLELSLANWRFSGSARFSSKISEQATYNNIGNAPALFRGKDAPSGAAGFAHVPCRILSETALLAIGIS